MEERAHVVVSGRVQGVWFRQSTAEEARRRNVTGWVRNLPDGRVEAVFEGATEAVEAMIAFVTTGPPAARVDDVHVAREADRREFSGFGIR